MELHRVEEHLNRLEEIAKQNSEMLSKLTELLEGIQAILYSTEEMEIKINLIKDKLIGIPIRQR